MTTRLTLQVPANRAFTTEESRERFAAFVADILCAGQTKFVPQELNATTAKKREFSVAANNDWWVFFDRDDTTLVHIQQRYGVMEALEPLCQYLTYVWRAKLLTPAVA